MPTSRRRAAFSRASGVLLHPTSLPGGRIGDEARRFVDWLASAGQRWWQVLPLGPPDAHGSPYSSPSAFAGSPSLLANPRARVSADEIEAFVRDHPAWIGGWAAYTRGDAIADQVRFAREWGIVRDHAHARGVSILGDIPFYVAADSADVRNHPELFQRDQVAGVPPDDWSATGQHWGNPVYDWSAMRNDRYRWWVERFRRTLELVDAVRIDHFRGFVAYWSIPEQHRTARHGHWRRSRGREVFETVWRELGPVPVVAENLGVITPAVERLREEFGMPGCVVLQFMFTDNLHNRPRPPTDDNVVIYTGTHDNDTTNGWWSSLSPPARARVDAELARLDVEEARPSWKLIRLAFASNADTAIVPAQDLLDLGTRARMNHPGRVRGSWRWQLQRGMLGPRLAAELRDLTEASRRLGSGLATRS